MLAICQCSFWIFLTSLYQLLENFTFFARQRCNLATFFWAFMKALIGSMCVPSDRATIFFTPRSIPTAFTEGCTGSVTLVSVWIDTYQWSISLDTITFLYFPLMYWLLRNTTHPILGRKIRLLLISKPCGYRKLSLHWPLFLNTGNRFGLALSKASLVALARAFNVCCCVCDGASARNGCSFFHMGSMLASLL